MGGDLPGRVRFGLHPRENHGPTPDRWMVTYPRGPQTPDATSAGEAVGGVGEFADGVVDDVGDRAHILDAAGHLARQCDRRIHVATEVEALRVTEVVSSSTCKRRTPPALSRPTWSHTAASA